MLDPSPAIVPPKAASVPIATMRVVIAEVQPEGPVLAKYAAYPAEDRDHLGDVLLWRRFKPELASSLIVAQAPIGRGCNCGLD